MIDAPGKLPEQREPLAALHIYQPLPTHKIFPIWEWMLKFGWIGALVAVACSGYLYRQSQLPKSVVQTPHFAPVAQWTSDPGFHTGPAISQDGKLVAYSSDREGNGSLAIWIRPFDSGKPARLTSGGFNETDPDFSPDARRIAFRSERDGGGIYLQSVAGGAPKLVAKNGRKPRFSPDGKWIAFFTLSGSEDLSASKGLGQIFVVSSEGGEPRRIQPAFPYARYPIWAPDSRHLLFTGTRRDGLRDWWLTAIEGGEASRTHAVEWLNRSLKTAGYPEQWQGDRILFSGAEESDAHIWELPISASSMQVTGPPRRLTNGKDQEQQIAVASGGRLMFASLHLSSDIWSLSIRADRAEALGDLEPVTRDAAKAQLPSISSDGSKMVYLSNKSGVRDIWISNPDGKAAEAVTSFRQIGYRPVLSPDGKLLVYPAAENGKCVVKLQDLPSRRAAELKGCFSISDWSPDGSGLLTFRPGLANAVELMKISTGQRQTVLFHQSSNLFSARFSPDGRWIAFAAGATGARARVFIAPLRTPPPPEREWVAVSPDTGGDPAWSPDGGMLYFRAARDGYQCIWAQKLGPGKRPAGEPAGILHLHSALSMNFLRPAEAGIAVTKDRLTLNLGRTTGALWTMTMSDTGKSPK